MFILGRAFDGNLQEDTLIYVITFPVLLVGAVAGGWMGIMQWLVLRQQRIARSSKWILASSLGTAVGTLTFWLIIFLWGQVFLPMILVAGSTSQLLESSQSEYEGQSIPLKFEIDPVISPPLLFGFILWGFIGLSQWLILRRWVHQAGWWILTVIVSAILGIGFIPISLFSPISIPLIVSISVAIVMMGAISGIVLLWLFRSRKNESPISVK
jgi:hypothetical protein